MLGTMLVVLATQLLPLQIAQGGSVGYQVQHEPSSSEGPALDICYEIAAWLGPHLGYLGGQLVSDGHLVEYFPI